MQRTFIIGDDWLYYKIYCGEKTADMLLTEVIKPISNHLVSNKLIEKWFFIRYTDPDFHLRWRMLLPKQKNFTRIISLVFEKLTEFQHSGLINRVQTDTYKRELERYGKNTIEFSESLFYYESEMIVNFINMIEGEDGEKLRWLFSMKYIDKLLSDFNLPLSKRFELMQQLADGFGKEFNLNSSLIIQLSDKYRKNKSDIFNFMKEDYLKINYNKIFKLIENKSERSEVIIGQIRELEKNENIEIPANNLLSSYIHMFMNRLFRSKQRVYELVLYGFLFRYYRTQIAREKYAK